mgnify:FL=1|jgi:hypothetical protein
MSLDLTKQRLYSIEIRVNNFIDQNIVQWATEEILLPGQIDIANSVSQRASEALSIEKTGFMKVDLKWDFRNEEGAPIHFFLEYGTRPHEIRAKGRDNGGADALHWTGPSGENRFAKVVQHPGTQSRELISQIKEERIPDLRRRIIDETQNYMELEAI